MITASPNGTSAVTGRRRKSDNTIASARHHSGISEGPAPLINYPDQHVPRDAANGRLTSNANQSATQSTPKCSSASHKSMISPNFSIPLTGTPNGRKHRPLPLDLGVNNNKTEQHAKIVPDANIKMTLKEILKSAGLVSPLSPKVM